MEWFADFWAWAWARHHNPLSWYLRPFFVLPFCYFAYRKNRTGLVLTVVGVLTSMFWFPAPSEADPRAAEFLAMEQQYVTGGWTWPKTFMTLLVPLWFVVLGAAFWRRSWIVGLSVINVGAALKVVWSFYFGGASAWSIIPPVLLGTVVCNAVVIYVMRRRTSGGTTAAVLLLAAVLAGCSSSTSPADAPEGHTQVIDGVPHAPGSSDPLQNCADCHGATLEGGPSGEPSCFTCHGRKW